jgi:iron complex transport system substrate-binding protein
MQSETEWLVKMGDAHLLVARTDYDRQPELAALPSIGGGLDPSAEAVAALRPDVVIGWRIRSSSDLEHALAPFHIPVLSFETTDTADVFRNLARLGALVGQPHLADSLAADLRAQLAEVRRTSCGPDTTRQSVLVVLSTDPPMTAGGGTWVNSLLDTACLRNVFEDLAGAWPTVSLEAISARQPQWLLVSRSVPGQQLAKLRAMPGWRDLEAVRAGHLIEVSDDLIARAGPNLGAAARAIVAARRAAR